MRKIEGEIVANENAAKVVSKPMSVIISTNHYDKKLIDYSHRCTRNKLSLNGGLGFLTVIKAIIDNFKHKLLA